MLTALEIKILAGLALLAAVLLGLHFYDAHQQQLGEAQAQAAAAAQALAGERAARAESDRRVAKQQENLNEDQRFASARAADAASLGAAVQRVRDTIATSSRPAAADPTASGASAAVSATVVVRSDLLSSLVQRAADLAAAVDCQQSAGKLCAADYDALTPGAGSGAKP